MRLFPSSELSPLLSDKFGVSEFLAKTKVPRKRSLALRAPFWLEQLAGPMTRALPRRPISRGSTCRTFEEAARGIDTLEPEIAGELAGVAEGDFCLRPVTRFSTRFRLLPDLLHCFFDRCRRAAGLPPLAAQLVAYPPAIWPESGAAYRNRRMQAARRLLVAAN